MTRPLHPEERAMRAQLKAALARGSSDHYTDGVGYDHEYQGRREDVRFYVSLAGGEIRPRVPRGPILELGCGSGRLTIPLARAGHQVVGVDASRAMIARARTQLDRLGGLGDATALHVADFRDLGGARSVLGRSRFPLVICPFNAFQHLYAREDVERFLAGVKAHLAPGGMFVFDVMNPDLRWLSRDSTKRWGRTRYKDPTTRAEMIYSHDLVYDSPLQIAFMTIYYEPAPTRARGRRSDGNRARTRRSLLTLRLFYPLELEALLHYNGWEIVRRDGDFEGGSLQPESEQQVLWCRPRPGSRRSRPRAPRRKTQG